MKKAILFVPFVLFLVGPAMAQRGYVKDKVEDKYEEKNKKEYGEPGMNKYNDWMNGKVLNVKVEPEYAFNLSMTMQVTGYKKGEKRDPTYMKYFISTPKGYFATAAIDKKNNEEMFMIYDLKANAMLMLDTKKMTGMAININAFMSGEAIANREKKLAEGPGKDAHPNTNCKKTGKTKTIQGYSCDEFVCVDEEKNTRTEMWITNKIPVNISHANMRGPFASYFRNMGDMGGMMMEANFYKNDVIESNMLVTELNEKANRVEVMKNYKMNGQ